MNSLFKTERLEQLTEYLLHIYAIKVTTMAVIAHLNFSDSQRNKFYRLLTNVRLCVCSVHHTVSTANPRAPNCILVSRGTRSFSRLLQWEPKSQDAWDFEALSVLISRMTLYSLRASFMINYYSACWWTLARGAFVSAFPSRTCGAGTHLYLLDIFILAGSDSLECISRNGKVPSAAQNTTWARPKQTRT